MAAAAEDVEAAADQQEEQVSALSRIVEKGAEIGDYFHVRLAQNGNVLMAEEGLAILTLLVGGHTEVLCAAAAAGDDEMEDEMEDAAQKTPHAQDSSA